MCAAARGHRRPPALHRLAQRLPAPGGEIPATRPGTARRDAPGSPRPAAPVGRRRSAPPGSRCGAARGTAAASPAGPPSSMPATLWIMLTSSASAGVRSGSSPGSRAASIDLPAPGGPTSSRLWPPAAAISSARRAVSMPFTSAMSGEGPAGASPLTAGRRQHLRAAEMVDQAQQVGRRQHLDACPPRPPRRPGSPGRSAPAPRAEAAIAAGSTPATGFSEPSSESSPSAA